MEDALLLPPTGNHLRPESIEKKWELEMRYQFLNSYCYSPNHKQRSVVNYDISPHFNNRKYLIKWIGKIKATYTSMMRANYDDDKKNKKKTSP